MSDLSKVALVCLPVYAGMPIIHFGGSYPGWKPSVGGIIRESGLRSTQEVAPLSNLQGDKVDKSDGNNRPEKMHTGDSSLWICWECGPLLGVYLESFLGRDCDI